MSAPSGSGLRVSAMSLTGLKVLSSNVPTYFCGLFGLLSFLFALTSKGDAQAAFWMLLAAFVTLMVVTISISILVLIVKEVAVELSKPNN